MLFVFNFFCLLFIFGLVLLDNNFFLMYDMNVIILEFFFFIFLFGELLLVFVCLLFDVIFFFI